MDKEIKPINNEFTTLYDDKRDKYSNRIYIESDNFSCFDHEMKTRNLIEIYNIPPGFNNSAHYLNYPNENNNNITNQLYFNNFDNLQINYNQLPSEILKLPIRTINDDEFIYVNMRQYKRILIRRKQREKQNLSIKYLNNKPKYQHESRHRHACTRERGKGGRFTSKKEQKKKKNNILYEKINQIY